MTGDTLQTIVQNQLMNICDLEQTQLPVKNLTGQTYDNESTPADRGRNNRQAMVQLAILADGVP